MGIFDRFRRNRQESVLPDEVREYYEAGQQPRRGVAILLTIGALLVTVLIAVALFFAGRFIYDQIWGDNQNKQETSQGQVSTADDHESSTQNQNSNSGQGGNQNQQSQQQDQGNQGSGGQSGQQPSGQSGQGQGSTGGSGSNGGSTGGGQGGASQAPAPTTTPALGDMPRTGDEGM